ncbi:DUF397 domain-containing protein [Actinomadura opuntiae]|uniref:DUF397 domain-containing protein n=1 Tax=Actinomadura sp. OS1-43 TaxID=604315 RepID=UPI00255A891C|nr:DUF397 domain-containing protein [Actinomadura sp. OS1-43]MDL4813361.1 DUF397 domain-containing protein [Actinomadura sp. OS1-43]
MTQWRKSSRSSGTHGATECVELATLADGVGVRDSKDADGGHVTVERAAFAALLARIRSGVLDLV